MYALLHLLIFDYLVVTNHVHYFIIILRCAICENNKKAILCIHTLPIRNHIKTALLLIVHTPSSKASGALYIEEYF